MTTMTDDRGTPLRIGDTVTVLYVDRGRGAEQWMGDGRIIGFGRSRVRVQFAARTEPQSVGAECLRVVNRPVRPVGCTAIRWSADGWLHGSAFCPIHDKEDQS